jgi:hypothetical protein
LGNRQICPESLALSQEEILIVRWKEADDLEQLENRNRGELQTVFDTKLKDAVELVKQE